VKFGFGCIDAEAAVREALRLTPPAAAVAARPARETARVAARPGARGALPNLFDFIIEEALAAPGATADSVAEAIARSPPFLTAVQLGMAHVPPAAGIPSKAQVTRSKLGKAFSAPTSGTMFS
jgi:hypothetical protein